MEESFLAFSAATATAICLAMVLAMSGTRRYVFAKHTFFANPIDRLRQAGKDSSSRVKYEQLHTTSKQDIRTLTD